MNFIYAVPAMSSILRKSARSDYAEASSDRAAGDPAAIPRKSALPIAIGTAGNNAAILRKSALPIAIGTAGNSFVI